MSNFTIYTDGSCLGNPGFGGWAAVIIDNQTNERTEIFGGEKNTTNNRMELKAVISALKNISVGESAELFTDSAYVKNALTKGWLENWKSNNWKTSNKKSVLNQDMWLELDKLVSTRKINFNWVRGHNGNFFNERCDQLANTAAQKIKNNENFSSETNENFVESHETLPTSKLKIAKKLQMKKYRAELKLFVAEGLRLCEAALNSAEIEFGFYTNEFLKSARAENLISELKKITEMHKIPETTFNQICDTQTPQGIMIIAKQKLSAPEEVAEKNFIVALDGVQDPGNVGTILRTAEAFDCGVILLDGAVDIFNAKVVRSTMGAIFNLFVTEMIGAEFLKLMQSKNFEVTAADLDSESEIYFNHDFKKKSAVVFGNEAEGVSEKILNASKKIYIPMSGKAESLNVATAAAIIISEVARQRF